MRYIFCLSLITIFAQTYTFGQFKNIVLDRQDSITRAPAEPSVAISYKDRDNIVGSAILDKVYVTKDGGKTWSKSRLTSSMGVWGDPVVISDRKGDFYYFHLSDPTGKNWKSEEILDRIVCQKSSDQGESWSDGASIGYNHPKDQDKEWAVADPNSGSIYASWTQFDDYGSKDSTCYSNILLSESNGGKKWSDPVQINQVSGDCIDDDNTVEGAVPAVGPLGQLYVAWSYGEKIYLDRSLDKGKTWLRNDIVVVEQPGGWTLNIPGLNRTNGMPVLICDNSNSQYRGSLYLNWSDQRNGEDDTDIWFMKSANHGDTWSVPVRVNDDAPGKHQFLSWMTMDETSGFIYIVYYDRRNYDDLQTDVYLAYSTDGGNSFVNRKISETPFTPDAEYFFGDYSNIAAHEGRIVPMWTRMDNGQTSIITAIIEQEELTGVERAEKKGKKSR
ncbi:sialidase family protein [Fulvivirga kasyanovii]|uniref:Exo-alpha-sialidase n=1 Tax=Fulvivirga kasyanovii TaxID=396812 RepID=A0ABW9RR61_9BACT|nr:sialidase family protein [Fulvivirga kasyanovii]MTI26677.1 exo-alpha-sialidase [Fulvivirga kasyanovii]